MKYNNKLSCSRLDATRKALYLCYGMEEPSVTDPPPRLLTRKGVADIMRVPINFVNSIIYKYFNPTTDVKKRMSLQPPKLNAQPSRGAKVTLKTITAEEVDYLVDPVNLRAWASYSLEWRCTLFHRKFPNRWISRFTIGRLMSRCGVKKKAIVVRRAPQRKTQRLDEFEDRIVALHERVKEIKAAGGHLVFIDECIFSARGFQMRAWA